MSGKVKTVKTLAVALFAIVALAAPAGAVAIIDFGTGGAGAGGTVTYSGGNVSGASIPLDSLTLAGSLSGSYDLSGALATSGTGGTSAVLDFNTLTNTITVVGGVPGLGIANGTTLLTGSFTSFSFTPTPVCFGPVCVGTSGQFSGTGPDTKGAALLTALGLPTNTPFQFFGFNLSFQPLRGSSYNGLSTDITNIGSPVPEPGSMLLFGTGLAGVLRSRLARKNKK